MAQGILDFSFPCLQMNRNPHTDDVWGESDGQDLEKCNVFLCCEHNPPGLNSSGREAPEAGEIR